NNAWILGRVQTNGKNDYVNVHTIQDGMELTPLSFYGKTYIPPSNVAVNGDVDVTIPPSAQVDKMDARSFYARLAEEMKMNPPTSADAAMVVKMKAIGLSPGESFAYSKLSDEQKRAVDAGFYTGFEKLHSAVPSNAKMENGWINNPTIGTYKTDYDSRAFIALVGLGANIRDDAVYFKARTDAIGARLNGNNKYVLRFAKGQTPPVNGFWSLSLYDEKNFFAKNSLKRYAIGDRDRLTYNSDGSLTLYIQAQSPGKAKESNWLPAPSENFSLVMRTYWPKQAILDGTWKIPSVQRTEMPPSRLSKK
ncbi:MAG TPA: DUF1214 domain-containing protein, partial [Bdellovibrio sp.]|nr:DUF1214 domain-containing protein [Bdellovibrio sp.]